MNNPLFKQSERKRYTDMAIWIDNNIYKEGCDMNTVFSYMYTMAYILAINNHYFNNEVDYDAYAYRVALDVYFRMTDPEKVRLKSSSNYMKSILKFRKYAYQREMFSEIIGPEYNKRFDSDAYTEKRILEVEANNRKILTLGINNILSSIPRVVRKSISKYLKADKRLYNNLYLSALLTLLKRFTLPRPMSDHIEKSLKNKPSFNIAEYYERHVDKNEIILWNLAEDYKDVVRVIVNKSYNVISHDIAEYASDFKVTDEEFKDMCVIELMEEGKFEEEQS